MNQHPLDQAVDLQPAGPGVFLGHTSPAYANMVGPFGGVTAATVLNAVWQHPDRQGVPVAFTLNFCAAVADGPFEVHAKVVRSNRSTQHWAMSIEQADGTVLSATALTATRRETWGVQDQAMPAVLSPAAMAPSAQLAPVAWLKRFDLRFAEGALPRVWDGAGDSSRSTLWMRDEPPRPLDFVSLASLCDAFYPRVLLRRATAVPAGTVSMTIYFHANEAELAAVGEGWLLGQAESSAFRHGFFDQRAQLWSQAGVLLATTHQMVYFKQ